MRGASDRPPAVRAARQCPRRCCRCTRDRPRRGPRERPRPYLDGDRMRGRCHPRADLEGSFGARAEVHLLHLVRRRSRFRQSDRDRGVCCDLGRAPGRVPRGVGWNAPPPATGRRLCGPAGRGSLGPNSLSKMKVEKGLVPRPGILDIAPYVGGEAQIAGVERPIRLASNESALGPSAKAVAAYRALAGEIHRYPEGNAVELREALGRRHGLDPARIVCSAGSDELIALLLRCYAGPGDEVLYSRHGFLMYPIGAMSVGATPIAAPERALTSDVDALLDRVTDRTPIVFIANPNNPTGTYLGAEEMARLHAGLPPSVLLAIDAAYAEFVNRNDYRPGVGLVDRAENVVMLRTFSKIYALAGLRLGSAYCPPAIAHVLNP